MALWLVFIFLLFLITPIDTDLGWHLRYGQQLLSTGQVMRQNELTYLLPTYQWSHSYTLYQLISFAIYKLGGLPGLVFANGLLIAFTGWLFSKIYPRLSRINALLFLIIIWAGWNVFHLGFRSQIFTFSGLVVVFLILKRVNKSPNLLFLLPLIFALWVNLHGGFVLGLGLLGFALIDIVLRKGWQAVKPLFSASLASVMATLVNPYGLAVYQEALRHLQVPLGTLIAEWVGPSTAIKISLISTTLVLLALILSFKNRQRLFWSFSLVLFTLLAYHSKRNLPLFALTAGLAFLQIFKRDLIVLEKNADLGKFVNFLLLVGIPFLLLARVPNNLAKTTNWNRFCTEGLRVYPCQAVEFIRAKKLKGKNVFSAYEWGGFLEWQLPEYKYFVDGRMPAWSTPEDKSPYTIYLEIIQARPGYQERLERYKTDWLLINQGTFLDIELRQNKKTFWQEIYRDNVAVIYTKTAL